MMLCTTVKIYMFACVHACMHRYTCTTIERKQKYSSKYLFCKGLYRKKDEFKKKKEEQKIFFLVCASVCLNWPL